MIHLDKPIKAPLGLLSRGNTATQTDCEAYIGNRAAYDSGKLKFNIIGSIYGSAKVRNALKTLQHDKCCYCESKLSATSAGRIDHFRPKSAVRQDKRSKRLYPGYFWLAYRWSNLVLACERCNLKKSDYFPLEEPGQRVRNHLESLDMETPLLLNPYVETEPSLHLTFDGSACDPRTERGRVTITVLGLNRPGLQEERQRVLDLLTSLCTVLRDPDGCHTLRRKARHVIDLFVRPDDPYSAMAHDYLSAVDEDTDNGT